jgi:hypothetical protein
MFEKITYYNDNIDSKIFEDVGIAMEGTVVAE